MRRHHGKATTEPAGHRRARTGFATLGTMAVLVMLTATGCSIKDSLCADGEYPAKAVGTGGGSYCVPDGQEPAKGYVRYPAGKVPQYIGDEWDDYWSTRYLDEHGKEMPEAGAKPSAGGSAAASPSKAPSPAPSR